MSFCALFHFIQSSSLVQTSLLFKYVIQLVAIFQFLKHSVLVRCGLRTQFGVDGNLNVKLCCKVIMATSPRRPWKWSIKEYWKLAISFVVVVVFVFVNVDCCQQYPPGPSRPGAASYVPPELFVCLWRQQLTGATRGRPALSPRLPACSRHPGPRKLRCWPPSAATWALLEHGAAESNRICRTQDVSFDNLSKKKSCLLFLGSLNSCGSLFV